MGSDSDFPIMREAADALETFGVSYEISILSAHRTPKEAVVFAESARKKGIRVVIAGAGGAAHLPGVIAAYTELPVIGVPIPIGYLQGKDALLSIVQMPKGVPVATVAIGGAFNAGILAVQIIGVATGKHLDAVRKYKNELRTHVLKKKVNLK